jgi:hypothetical protein
MVTFWVILAVLSFAQNYCRIKQSLDFHTTYYTR